MTTASSTAGMTLHDVEQHMKRAQRLMSTGDINEIMKTFAPDVVVRYADFPEIRGRPALEKFMVARFARQRNYKLQKKLRAVSGDVFVCSWDAEWEDGQNGRPMVGSGIEIVTMRGDDIAQWEATFNVWEKGTAASLPII
jgi:nuclear transport factor 2 (NTF2) superfamily protein